MNTPWPARQVVPALRHDEKTIAELEATSRARDLRRRLIALGLDDPGPDVAVDLTPAHAAHDSDQIEEAS